MSPFLPDDGRREIRDFCGRIPWPLVAELADGDEVSACYIVRESRRLQTRGGQPYIRLQLGDRSGTIEAVIWDDIERWEALCIPREIVGVRGRVSFYQDKPQLRVESMEQLRPASGDLEYLVPASRRGRDVMERELDAHVASVRERGLRALLRRCLGRDTRMGRAFREYPAATRNHHAFMYGLMEHTLSVTGICQRLAEHYREQNVAVDRDLLMTGALLHDIGKTEELDGPPAPAYTTPGKLLGHIVLGIHRVGEIGAAIDILPAERLQLVLHLIASHQGKPEWDSPRVPQILEAFILHYADDLDAKVNQVGNALSRVEPGAWSGWDRSLGRSLYLPNRAPGGSGGQDPTFDDSVIDLFRG